MGTDDTNGSSDTTKGTADPAANLGFGGIEVYQDALCVKRTWVKRTWRERLWSWPWRPWRRLRLVEEPLTYQLTGFNGRPTIVMHPALFEELKTGIRHGDE